MILVPALVLKSTYFRDIVMSLLREIPLFDGLSKSTISSTCGGFPLPLGTTYVATSTSVNVCVHLYFLGDS